MVEQFEEGTKLTRIAAAIYCEREGQKRILIGKQAQMLKKIGTAARLQIEKMVGTRVFLELFVKVSPDWRESHTFIEELDWRRQLRLLTRPGRYSRLTLKMPIDATFLHVPYSRAIAEGASAL